MPPKAKTGAKSGVRTTRPASRAAGAGNFAGSNFALDYTIYEALQLLAEHVADPSKDLRLRAERRTDNTAWDLGLEPGGRVTEIKLQPTNEDVLEWLDRVAASDSKHEFVLIGGHRSAPFQRVQSLTRLAREASDDVELKSLAQNESGAHTGDMLARLGTSPVERLRKMSCSLYDPGRLRDNDLLARALAGEHAARLIDYLFHRLARAAAIRETLSITDLITDLAKSGIALRSPPWTGAALSPEARRIVCILQELETPIAPELLCEAAACDMEELETLVIEERVGKDELGCRLPRMTPRLEHPERSSVLLVAMNRMVAYLKDGQTPASAIGLQCSNLVALMAAVRASAPEAVARVFWELDKQVKESGSKRSVLDLAWTSILASRYTNRGTEAVKAEAVALVCGVSWVYQRTERLAEARAEAEKSYELGEQVGWKRNTAYYQKCAGRIARMQAERASDSESKQHFIRESEALLLKAIDTFPTVEELTSERRRAEAAEARSLLARTYLVEKSVKKAWATLEAAKPDLTVGTKPWVDACILEAELLASEGAWERTQSLCAQTIDLIKESGREVSEMTARLRNLRAHALARLGDRSASVREREGAVAIWEQLGETRSAARAKWALMLARDAVPNDAKIVLEKEQDARARVQAMELHTERLKKSRAVAVGQRANASLGATYWQGLLEQARAKIACEDLAW